MEIFKHTNFDFLGKKWPFIYLSLLLTVIGVISLFVKGGPKYGIDFTGGALMDVSFLQRPNAEAIRSAIHRKIPGEVSVQEVSGTPEVYISTGVNGRDDQSLQNVRADMVASLNAAFNPNAGGKLDINTAGQATLTDKLREPLARGGANFSDTQLDALTKQVTAFRDTPPRSGLIKNLDQLGAVPGVTPKILDVIKAECYPGSFTIRNVEVVGPKIGSDLRQQAVNVVLIALAAMLIYIAFRFEWIYGVAAVIAVFHDTIITIGLFSLFNRAIDLTVIAALLTLVGYSMNDTIVTFDRIRENLKLHAKGSFEEVVNRSINQTLSRTVLTSGLTFLTAISLYLFGGPVLNGFSFALVVGIMIGTYSSIFVASPILVYGRNLLNDRSKTGRSIRSAAVTPTSSRPVARNDKGVVKPVR